MNHPEHYLNILMADKNLYTILWNSKDGWMQSGDHNFLSISEDNLAEKGFHCLLDIVADEDRELCQSFLNTLNTAPTTNNPVNHQTVSLHLLAPDQTSLYCRIVCDSLWVNEKLNSTICRIRELTSEEIYRLHLAQTITNDKNPVSFAKGVKDIMNANPNAKYAVIQFDISKFKIINEQYGEDFGNEILQFIIHGLTIICGKDQLYARLSADLFMVFTTYDTQQDLMDLVTEITQKLSTYKGVTYRLDFGICPFFDRDGSLRTYGDNATIARKSVKNNALTHVAFYDEEAKKDAHTRKFIEDRMESALENEEFLMFLQPKYSISQNKIVGAEALVRWLNPERGMLQPNDFIPLFEQNNFIIKVDYYIWEQACKAIRNWIDAGIEPIPISVNMSQKHLNNTDFIQVLNNLIEKYQIDRSLLEIEITETAKATDVASGVNILKDNGYTLLMDDFGSGYSTFNSLKDTKFDVLKIDRELLQNFIGSERGEKIIEHIVKMTQSIGLDLIAEGVENREQTVFLSKCGCDKVQGYYYAKPMSLEDFNHQRN